MTLQAGYEPLLEAIRDANIPCLERLLSSKQFSVNTEIPYQSEDGKPYIITPLYWAVKLEQPEICRFLLENNADPYRHMVYEYYPLHEACNRGNSNIVQEFILSGCDLNHPNSDGDTPLHIASMRGHVDCIKLLLSAGVNRTLRNSKGETPLQAAQFTNQTDLYKLFEVFDKGPCSSSLLHSSTLPRLHRPLSSDYTRYNRPSTQQYHTCINGSHDDTLLRDTRYSRPHRQAEQVSRTNSFSGSGTSRHYFLSYNSSSLTRPHHAKKSSLLSQQQQSRSHRPSLINMSQHDSQLVFPTQSLVSDPRRTQTCHDFGKDIPQPIEDRLYPSPLAGITTRHHQQQHCHKVLSPTDEVESDSVSAMSGYSQGGGPKLRVHHMVQYLNQAVAQKYGGSGFDTAYLPLLTSIHSDLNFSLQEFESLQNFTGEFCDNTKLSQLDHENSSLQREGVELVWGCDYDIIDYNPLHIKRGMPTHNYVEMLFKVRLHPQEESSRNQHDGPALLRVIADVTNSEVKESEEREGCTTQDNGHYHQSIITTTTCTELQIINSFPPHPNLLQILHHCQAHSRPFERFTKLFTSDGENLTDLKIGPQVQLIFLNNNNSMDLFESYLSSRRRIQMRAPYGIEERMALMFLAQLLLALSHLDQYGIIVTHLTPGDILFDSRHHLVLTGLSHALRITESTKYNTIKSSLQDMSLNTSLGFSPELSYLRDSSSLPSGVPSLVSYLQSSNSYTAARLFHDVFTDRELTRTSEILYEEPTPELTCFSSQLRNIVEKMLTLTFKDRPNSFQAALCCFILLFGPTAEHCSTLSDCQQWLVTETCHFFLRPSLKGQPSTYSSDIHTKLLFIYLLIVTPETLHAATKLVYESTNDR